jgi:hypothetical protein
MLVILLDKAVLGNLVDLPRNPTLEEWLNMIWHHGNGTQWVKFIDTDERKEESCRAIYGTRQGYFTCLGIAK